MRKLIFAAASAAALVAIAATTGGFAQAAVIGPSSGVRAAIDDLNMIENAQFTFQGRRHCWYSRGWNGQGWYRCGYHVRNGRGWGGGEGWNGWQRR